MPTKPLSVRYEDDLRLLASRWRQAGTVVLALLLLIFPLRASSLWLTLGSEIMVLVVGAVGLMILTGFTGQISLGHSAFIGIGGYTAAILGTTFGVPFWVIIPIAGVLAAAVGMAVGPFALRLKGLYLAIVTLGLVFLVAHVLRSFPEVTGGLSGLAVPMLWWFDGPTVSSLDTSVLGTELSSSILKYYIFLVLAVFAVLFATNLRRSHTGRAMAAVRDRDGRGRGADQVRRLRRLLVPGGGRGGDVRLGGAVPDHRCHRQPVHLDRVHRDHRHRRDRHGRRRGAGLDRVRGARTARGCLPRRATAAVGAVECAAAELVPGGAGRHLPDRRALRVVRHLAADQVLLHGLAVPVLTVPVLSVPAVAVPVLTVPVLSVP